VDSKEVRGELARVRGDLVRFGLLRKSDLPLLSCATAEKERASQGLQRIPVAGDLREVNGALVDVDLKRTEVGR
jgi:predicted RNA-binding protein